LSLSNDNDATAVSWLFGVAGDVGFSSWDATETAGAYRRSDPPNEMGGSF
jgi:hypothetical protein